VSREEIIGKVCLRATKAKRNYGLELQELGREMGIHTIMFHTAVAERLGLNITDHKCLDHILRTNGATAGELSRFTGLTTGAITGVIDRLERAGFARRQPDPQDRRKVIVVPLPERLAEVGKLFESISRNMSRVMSRYPAQEAEILIDFMQNVRDIMRQENLKLRSQSGRNNGRRAVSLRSARTLGTGALGGSNGAKHRGE
jgi:DNA-binding MarR family transcriptional regulator